MGKRITVFVVSLVAVMLLAAPVAMAAISMTSISPDRGDRGTTVNCTVYGSFWHPLSFIVSAPTFQLVSGATTIDGTTTGIMATTGEKAYVTFDLPAAAPTGWYTLKASQTHGIWPTIETDTASLSGAFYVQQRPLINNTNPVSVMAGSGNLTLTVYGNYFFSTTIPPPARKSTVRFNGVAVTTDYSSSTVITAHVPAAAVATPGTVELTVYNPGLVLLDIPSLLSDPYSFTILAPTPTIAALDPASAVVGGPAFNLIVTGTNFVTGPSGAVVRWNGIDLAPTRDSATHLTAAVPASRIAAAGSATIAVRNGTDPGAPLSNSLSFSIGNVVPAVTSISPTSVWAGYVRDDVTLTVTGSNFLSGAHVMLGATEKSTTTFVSAAQLTVPLLAADIATAGTIDVGVKNPPPGGGTSATTQPLAVQADTTDPTVSIAGADSGWHNTPVPLTFTGSDSQSGLQAVQYRCPPAVPAWTTDGAYTVPDTTQGEIVVYAQATDWCNRSASTSATVRIDTTDPETDALSAVSVKRNKTARLKFRITEPAGLSPSAKVVLKVKTVRGNKTVKTKTIRGVPVNSTQSYSFKVTFKKGAYKWYIYATDLAGNTQANVDKASFTVK
jgi:hypothetical protein